MASKLPQGAPCLLPLAFPHTEHDFWPFCPTMRSTCPAPCQAELQLLPALNHYCLDLIHVLLFQLALHPPLIKDGQCPHFAVIPALLLGSHSQGSTHMLLIQ